jgi:thiamine-phosphate pyrophosphorylase
VTSTFTLPRVYPITDKRIAQASTHLSVVKELVRGGATLVQIRDKETPARQLIADIRRCIDFARPRGVKILVNDRCDLVLCTDADGVHLGQDDLPAGVARRLLGSERVIGYSTHSPAQARIGAAEPVQYIGFGPIYETTTKPGANPVTGLRTLKRVCAAVAKPVVAIGGIGLEQIPEVFDCGAASVAVISALLSARSIPRMMDRFIRATERG